MKQSNPFLKSKFVVFFETAYLITLLLLVLLFGRAAQGVFVGNVRIAEILFVVLIIFTFLHLKLDLKKFSLANIYTCFFVFFIFLSIIGGFNFPDSFRYSSFVFSFTVYLVLENIFESNKSGLNVFSYFIFYTSNLSIILFVLNIIFNGGLLNNLFFNISDKPTSFIKPSEIAVVVVFTLFFIIYILENKYIVYVSIAIVGSSIPIIIYFSRGATLGLLFGIIVIYYFAKNKSEVIKLFCYIFIFSLFSFLYITPSLNNDDPNSIFKDFKVSQIVIEDYDKPNLNCENDTFNISLSTDDGNINWRLWVLEDIVNCTTVDMKKFLIGYGFNNPIVPMETPLRSGYDGLNIHPHNFFLTVFYRMGLVGLVFIILIFLLIFKKTKYLLFSPSLIAFIIVGSFGVVFEGFTQLVFWIYIYIENNFRLASS